ncbi:hypothetical protein [Pseudomonas sp. RIT-PI-r]|uniref:hypothetical protein n=1 Tax=Pseudomonas sp. RIT-PI-r TaxID=1699620 RepID=UPI0006D6B6D1|nr:hypothetical protein [Pseudomonas sp. RIT-PI-r]KPG94477.1 hypothetical protein AK821_19915 [Pseudomonas sp. RIT-PI-r]
MNEDPKDENIEGAENQQTIPATPRQQPISSSLADIRKWIEEAQKKIIPFLEQLAKVDWQAVKARIESMPKLSRDAMQTASAQGWFFNMQNSMEDTFEIIEGLQNATSEQLDEILKAHFTKDMNWYARSLYEKYPARRTAIEAAVLAHKNKEQNGYFVSIPVFLAQADGLLSEIAETPSAMDKKNGVVRGSTWVKTKIGSNQQATDLLHPILNLHELDILKSKATREAESFAMGKSFSALNRHQVMHGEVSDYGTEINSLKAFSFLVCVGLHIPDVIANLHFLDDGENEIPPESRKDA